MTDSTGKLDFNELFPLHLVLIRKALVGLLVNLMLNFKHGELMLIEYVFD